MNSHNVFTWIRKSCCLIRIVIERVFHYLLRWYLLLIKLECFSIQLRSSCLVQTVYSFNEVRFIYRPLKCIVRNKRWVRFPNWTDQQCGISKAIYSSRTLQYRDFLPLTAVACLLTGVNDKLKLAIKARSFFISRSKEIIIFNTEAEKLIIRNDQRCKPFLSSC